MGLETEGKPSNVKKDNSETTYLLPRSVNPNGWHPQKSYRVTIRNLEAKTIFTLIFLTP